MFKFMNPKLEDQASVRNDSHRLNLLVYWAGLCKQCVYLFLLQQNKNLYITDFCSNLQTTANRNK